MRTHLVDLAASGPAPLLLAVAVLGLVSVYLAGYRRPLDGRLPREHAPTPSQQPESS
ncbi:hypothetical protein [Streptomyces sp. NPDC047123]|uniref:hypothetical protein n=1 Tax=unclassified Streptomyces TaxID=2593676 RepID=UPI0033C55FE6